MPQQPFQRQQTAPAAPKKEILPADQQNDLSQAEKLKAEANGLFKEKKEEQACKKYLAAINVLRCNEGLMKTKSAKETEMACRSNLALCQLNLKDFHSAVDHCEKVLEYDPKNLKASYRLSQALYNLSDGENASQIKAAFKHATTAHNGIKNDDKVKAFYEQVKSKHDEVLAKE